MDRSKRVRALALACILAIAVAPGVASAQESKASEGGWGALSALCTLVYGPVKVTYAGLGLIFGGFAWGLSGGDGAVMEAVVTPAVRGDYVVTPGVLRGQETLEFIGRDPEYRRTQIVAEESWEDDF